MKTIKKLMLVSVVFLVASNARAAPVSFMGIGYIPGGAESSFAHGVSADGSVVVGQAFSSQGFEAFRWTSTGGMVGLGDLAGGGYQSGARGVSGDGTTMVDIGWRNAGSGGSPRRYYL